MFVCMKVLSNIVLRAKVESHPLKVKCSIQIWETPHINYCSAAVIEQ